MPKNAQKCKKGPIFFKILVKLGRNGPPYSYFVWNYLIAQRNNNRCQKMGRGSHFRDISAKNFPKRSKLVKICGLWR